MLGWRQREREREREREHRLALRPVEKMDPTWGQAGLETWMYGWMDGWMDGWMGGWMKEMNIALVRTNGCLGLCAAVGNPSQQTALLVP